MTSILDKPEVLRLSSANAEGKVWVMDRGWKKLCTVNQVVDAVRFVHGADRHTREEVSAQLDDLVEF